MKLSYVPKESYKDYVEIKGSSQLPQFIAVTKGIKPVMDDWIPVCKYDRFKKVCEKHGLIEEPDWVFVKSDSSTIKNAIDSSRLNTTKFVGVPFKRGIAKGEVHVFVSKSKEQINEAKKFGWYPLIINGRSFHKPRVDHSRFGKVLGYPECCIDFFRKFNNHNIYNNLYETLKNTEESPSFLCNPVFAGYTYSMINHIPCSYSCKKTMKYTGEILAGIENEEPELAQQIRNYLKLPLLVFQEKNTYAFSGKIKGNKIFYDEFVFLGRRQDDSYEKLLRKGNCVEVHKDKIEVLHDSSLISSIPKTKEENGFIMQFK